MFDHLKEGEALRDRLRPATESVGDMNSQGPLPYTPGLKYRDPRDPKVQEELARERAEERLQEPAFRLEALEQRVTHIEEYLQSILNQKFRPLKNEDLL
jgi:hypothetical protein